MSIDQNTKITMLGLDGGVKYVPLYMKEELLKKGWKVITNPKEEYYPQYDQTLQGYFSAPDVVEEVESNFLEVTIL